MLPRSVSKKNKAKKVAGKSIPETIITSYSKALVSLERSVKKGGVLFLIPHLELVLAKEGYCGEVFLLISAFNRSKNLATVGFAFSGYREQVEALILEGVALDHAIEGYAAGGFVNEVNDLILRGGSLNKAVWIYAAYGYIKQVNDLFQRNASAQVAATGYACGGFFDNKEALTYLLANTENTEIRQFFAEAAKHYLATEDIPSILTKANMLHEMMRKYQINYDQACSLKIKGVRSWLLQGIKLVNDNILPLDMFIVITQNIFSLSTEEILQLQSSLGRYHYHLQNVVGALSKQTL